jgi:hypothetical protein
MKRVVVFLILLSMMLHCSIRLGFVTWLYQNRQSIAYTFGFIEERPITMCSHEHDLDRAVEIKVSHDEGDKIPVSVFHAREINLFLESDFIPGNPQYSLLRENRLPWVIESNYPSPEIYIFHPPA